MSFVQWEFLVFFALVYGAYWALRRPRWQNLLLALASALFYGWVHPWFLCLLYGSALLDFHVGKALVRWPDRRRALVGLSLAGNLGMLGTFKYCDFFIENVAAALDVVGLDPGLRALGLMLPVGISFYTFQTLSYTLDIARGRLEPRAHFLDYVAFVSFFPQLVAGPVERARDLLPQLERPRRWSAEDTASGAVLALWGLFKKVAIADTVAPYVDRVFALPEPPGSLIWAAAVGFSIQILADFSGYTDIARGTARMLGVRLCDNFRAPYLATSPSEFWRRWHVSFSTWIRDYVYIPLGGSRGTWGQVTRSTFGAMLLSGLWHGASWTFVLWGAYHAALLTVYRAVTPLVPASWRVHPLGRGAAVVGMYALTVVGWLIFRETDPARLGRALALAPWDGDADAHVLAGVLLATCLLCALPLWGALLAQRHLAPRLAQGPWRWPARSTVGALLALAAGLSVRTTTQDFIYFQF